ncbi:MAG: silent information regulator protein Sir2 [Candidatus Omnitrophota bacterium]
MNARSFFQLSIFLSMFAISGWTEENLDRGMIALERPDGVYIGWRSLISDPPDMKFDLTRENEEANTPKRLTLTDNSTNYIDAKTEKGKKYLYKLLTTKEKVLAQCEITVTGEAKNYISIPLQGDYDFQKFTVADLDGDGELEYLVKQPNFNTDPYQQPGYWKRSEDTYKIEAYKRDGTLIWRYDMGWAIEEGIWYSPWIVYDVDGDGKAEVYCKAGEGDPREPTGQVMSGPEYLVKIDGQTGKVVAKTDWLPRDGYQDYNRYCRNFLAVAYLDGKTPSLIMQRGTYRLIRTKALDKDFKELWLWQADADNKDYQGQGSHGLIAADVDGDGRDELVIGAAVIDDNGKNLWTLKMGHPDFTYVADIDPSNPGLEIFYGFETRQPKDGLCVVDAKTGRKLWAHPDPTFHIHGQGMAADVLAQYPGMEVYGGERDYDKRWFYNAKGELIKLYEKTTLTPRALWWDADPQKEVVWDGAIRDWDGDAQQKVEGTVIAAVDCLGDAREELVTSLKGEIRIYSTTIPTKERRTCLLQDRQYRLGIAAQTMGYYYPAQLGEFRK